jgi:hypothetical protein
VEIAHFPFSELSEWTRLGSHRSGPSPPPPTRRRPPLGPGRNHRHNVRRFSSPRAVRRTVIKNPAGHALPPVARHVRPRSSMTVSQRLEVIPCPRLMSPMFFVVPFSPVVRVSLHTPLLMRASRPLPPPPTPRSCVPSLHTSTGRSPVAARRSLWL